MWVIPERTDRKSRNIYREWACRLWNHLAKRIIANAQRGYDQAVRMQVGRVRLVREGSAAQLLRVGWQAIDDGDVEPVAWLHAQRRARKPSLVGRRFDFDLRAGVDIQD